LKKKNLTIIEICPECGHITFVGVIQDDKMIFNDENWTKELFFQEAAHLMANQYSFYEGCEMTVINRAWNCANCNS
jgi:hypothetical protein